MGFTDDRPGAPLKIGACVCMTALLITGMCFMCFYYSLLGTASAFDEIAIQTQGALKYDNCGQVREDSELPFETGWTQAFKFQAVLYTIMVALYAISILSLCVPFLNQCIMCYQICTICPMIAAIILTGVRRLSTNGKVCAATNDIVDAETGETFADNGSTMKALFIAQCVMYIPSIIATSVGLQLSIMGDATNAT